MNQPNVIRSPLAESAEKPGVWGPQKRRRASTFRDPSRSVPVRCDLLAAPLSPHAVSAKDGEIRDLDPSISLFPREELPPDEGRLPHFLSRDSGSCEVIRGLGRTRHSFL